MTPNDHAQQRARANGRNAILQSVANLNDAAEVAQTATSEGELADAITLARQAVELLEQAITPNFNGQ